MDTLRRILKQQFGFADFRPHQREIIEAFTHNCDVFAALPTGGGKSLCFKLPAVADAGLTLVVSPLIALMKDQVDAARAEGIAASFLNSTLDADQARETFRELGAGRVSLLYVSPERLASERFRLSLADFDVRRIAIDEAHCISEWGHEFRPDYRTLGSLRDQFPRAPIAAFTATATHTVQSDIIAQLGLREPLVVRASFDRKEIFYRVEKKRDVEAQIAEFVLGHPEEPGIVYRATRKATEKTADQLRARGVRALAYHAGLSQEERRRRQDEFVRDRTPVIVATIAFGMGIDKSNVRWVVHGDLPKSLEGYYQQTGRAARDGEPAETVLYFSSQDISILRGHIDRTEDDTERARAEAQLAEVLRYVDSGVCRRRQLLAHFDEVHPGDCGACDVCTGEVKTVDATVSAQMLLSAAVRTGQRFGGHHLADIVAGNSTDRVLQLGHNELPTFAVGSDQSKSYWLQLVRDLESAGLLRRGSERTSGFHVTEEGRRVLRNKASFSTRIVEARGTREAVAGSGAIGRRRGDRGISWPDGAEADAEGASAAGGEEALFQRLRRLRLKIARERGVPPYTVFSDKSLKVMVRNRPVDSAGLLRCHGVGEHKLHAFGEAFLREIREFLSGG
ncbi:MAG: DNA helicase RecQ [Spirochaetia bacterium]